MKDKLGLKVTEMYCAPCECCEAYIEQTARTVETRCKEHMKHIYLGQPEISAVAEHAFEMGHNIKFTNTAILDKTPGYMDHVIKDTIEIKLHPETSIGTWFSVPFDLPVKFPLALPSTVVLGFVHCRTP
jgi:hypothetical protein